MSDYSQITYFTPKDSLSTGNPNKIIYGSDMDAELSAISTAIATKADVDGDAIGAGTPATELSVDNLKLDANKIVSTNTDGDIELEPNGTGTVVITNVDVAAGEIDGTAIGANSASTGAFTTLTASGDVNFDSGTFFVDASADAVGIGTTNPSAKLEIRNDVLASTDLDPTAIKLFNNNDGGSAIEFSNGVSGKSKISFGVEGTGPGTDDTYIGFSTSANAGALSEAMRITSAGNVGIGTSSPATIAEIVDTNPIVQIRDSTTSAGSAAITIRMGESDGSGNIENYWDMKVNGATGALEFIDNWSGGAGTGTRMVITDGGNVGIGTSSPACQLDVTGLSAEIRVNSSADNGGRIAWDNSSGVFKVGSFGAANYNIVFDQNGSERARIDTSGNLLLGGTGTPTSSAGNFVLYNGTAPTGNATDGVILYAEDVSTSSELKVRDEAGNVTTLSPHNFDLIPEGPSEDMAWSYYSERDGKRINVDMLKAIRVLEQLSGEKLVHMV